MNGREDIYTMFVYADTSKKGTDHWIGTCTSHGNGQWQKSSVLLESVFCSFELYL